MSSREPAETIAAARRFIRAAGRNAGNADEFELAELVSLRDELEAAIDRYNADLGPLKEFILPGGTRAAALAHLARGVCRRAERQLVGLAATEAVSEAGRKYVNRLSDLLFVLARTLNHATGQGDILWQHERKK